MVLIFTTELSNLLHASGKQGRMPEAEQAVMAFGQRLRSMTIAELPLSQPCHGLVKAE